MPAAVTVDLTKLMKRFSAKELEAKQVKFAMSVAEDMNAFTPEDTKRMHNSMQAASDFRQGLVIWDADYAAYVRDLIFPNEPDGSEEWARAVMAACEVDAAYGCSGGIMEGGGFTVGSFSWNPGTEGASTYRSDMEAAVRRELLGTPLLYAGIGGTR